MKFIHNLVLLFVLGFFNLSEARPQIQFPGSRFLEEAVLNPVAQTVDKGAQIVNCAVHDFFGGSCNEVGANNGTTDTLADTTIKTDSDNVISTTVGTTGMERIKSEGDVDTSQYEEDKSNLSSHTTIGSIAIEPIVSTSSVSNLGDASTKMTMGSTTSMSVTLKSTEKESSSDYKNLALILHNKIRGNHASQPMMLNESLSQVAQRFAEKLISSGGKLTTSPGRRTHGENVFKMSGGDPFTDEDAIIEAVKSWSASKSWYNFERPKASGFSQIVWNATTQLGVGLASLKDTSIVVVTYYPRGNVVAIGGKDVMENFKKNVFPEIENPEKVYP